MANKLQDSNSALKQFTIIISAAIISLGNMKK